MLNTDSHDDSSPRYFNRKKNVMYNPEYFRCNDRKEALELIAQYPFATMITVTTAEVPGSAVTPVVSHLPLVCQEIGDHLHLLGHMAKANQHWKALEGAQATIIFHGPQAYITSKWYAENDVPTWNYS